MSSIEEGITDITYQKIDPDLLIIGGGMAGCNVATAAAKKDAKVVIMDKAKIERSVDIDGGVEYFLAFLNKGKPWETREA